MPPQNMPLNIGILLRNKTKEKPWRQNVGFPFVRQKEISSFKDVSLSVSEEKDDSYSQKIHS